MLSPCVFIGVDTEGPPALHLFIWSGQFLDSMTQLAILVRPIKIYFNLA
jgi:hypothetical protein